MVEDSQRELPRLQGGKRSSSEIKVPKVHDTPLKLAKAGRKSGTAVNEQRTKVARAYTYIEISLDQIHPGDDLHSVRWKIVNERSRGKRTK